MDGLSEESSRYAEKKANLPVSPAALARAQEAVRNFSECFWFWHPDAKVQDREDVLEVVHNLREYGGKAGWQEASILLRCL